MSRLGVDMELEFVEVNLFGNGFGNTQTLNVATNIHLYPHCIKNKLYKN